MIALKKLWPFPALLTALFLGFAQPAHVPITSKPSPRDLPGDCAIVASEAASRLEATGAWTKIVHVVFITANGELGEHAVTVWIPPTSTHVFMYDEYLAEGGGSVDLDIKSKDIRLVASAIAKEFHLLVLEAHYVT